MFNFQGSKEKSGLDELEEVLAEDDKDIRERDALSSRIKERDRKNKRHVVSKSEASAQMEAAKRLKLSADIGSNHDEIMKKLREKSRAEYLPKRKEDKLYELRRQLDEDEIYFPEAELTDRERAERQRKREIIKAAEKYDQAGSLLTTQRYVLNRFFNDSLFFRYHMPDERKAVTDTLIEEKELPGGDARRWEDEQLHTGQFHVGAKDAKVDQDLDLLLEDVDRVDFIRAFQMKGENEEQVG